ncbi:MAG: hypothetical protein HQ567_11960 [Candidatus Nealsonbacteria bacterium]|nr:hypothetical protein [Candidatus Nealsonbacteria bacterium]
MSKSVLRRPRFWTILLLLIVTGCSPSDERLVELGQQSADRQAQQNQTIADQSRQVTETTQEFVESSGDARKEMIELQLELVEAEAEARSGLIQVQQDLVDRDAECRQELNELQRESRSAIQVERQSIDRQREGLETERRDIANKRHRAPIIAAAVTQVGLILACLAPLALCAYLLWSLRSTAGEDEAVTELLVEELVSDRRRLLLPGPPCAEQPALSNPAGPTGTEETGLGI